MITEYPESGLAVVERHVLIEGKNVVVRMNMVATVYDGSIGAYKPTRGHTLKEVGFFASKTQATARARELGIPLDRVQKLGTHLCKGWGIRYDFRYPYFYGTCIETNARLNAYPDNNMGN